MLEDNRKKRTQEKSLKIRERGNLEKNCLTDVKEAKYKNRVCWISKAAKKAEEREIRN